MIVNSTDDALIINHPYPKFQKLSVNTMYDGMYASVQHVHRI